MARETAPGLTAGEGRRFALTLAGAFAFIAFFARWRGHETISTASQVLSATLLIAALTIPRRLGPVEKAWSRLGVLLSRVTSPVFLGVVYFAVFTPAGWLRRVAGRNSIAHRAIEGSYWKTREPADAAGRRVRMERQF